MKGGRLVFKFEDSSCSPISRVMWVSRCMRYRYMRYTLLCQICHMAALQLQRSWRARQARNAFLSFSFYVSGSGPHCSAQP